MNIKEYIKQKIKEYDSTIDTSNGSPIGDLFINPLSVIYQDTQNFEESLVNNLSILDPTTMTDADMDKIAANFLVTRQEGNKASGYIRLYYNEPITVTIPKGTIFSNSAGTTYTTTSVFNIVRESMYLNNENYPLYHTGNIPIECTLYGTDYNAKPNTITNIVSFLSPEPVSATNPSSIVSSADRENNTALYNKILRHMHGKSVASADGIKSLLLDNYTTIDSLKIISAGDPEMVRDINYSGVNIAGQVISDYYSKISGLYEFPFNQSMAYAGWFADTDESTTVSLPEPSEFLDEFTNTMYSNMYVNNDSNYAELDNVLIQENFNSEETDTGYDKAWIASDGALGKNLLVKSKEISVDGNTLKLGIKSTSTATDYINMTASQLESYITALNAGRIDSVVTDLATYTSAESINNMSPVFQKALTKHVGVQFTGSFKTSDSSSEGSISYITGKRNSETAVPYDGYGLAWKKGDGTKYNVYIVDNDSLTQDVFVNAEQMWDQSGGINQFLAAAKKEILVDTWYQYVVKIYDKNAIDIWIYPEDSFPATLTSTNRTLYRGTTYPEYITQSAGDHFGIGVLQTKNSEWWYKNVAVSNIGEVYPMHLFKIKCKPTDFPDGDPFTLTYQGLGYDGDDTSISGLLKWYVRDQNTASWTLAGSNTHVPGVTQAELKMTKAYNDIADYRDASNFVTVLATPYNFTESTHELRSYYISATNSLLSGIHSGNHVDIYIDDKERILSATQTVVPDTQEVVLKNITGINLPIVDIISVAKTTTGEEFVENTDYTIDRPNEGTAFSITDNIRLIFSRNVVGISLTIIYRYYADGASIQTLLNSDTYRYPGVDNLGKVYPYSIVKLTKFDYKGDIAEDIMKLALSTYINSITDNILEASDLVNAAYDAGATYVDLATIAGTIRDQSYLGSYVNSTFSNTYTLSGSLKKFFADSVSLYGVNKID